MKQCADCIFYGRGLYDKYTQDDCIILDEQGKEIMNPEHYCGAYRDGIPTEIAEDKIDCPDKPIKFND